MDHVFGVVSKKSSPYPKTSRFSMLSSRIFLVFHFTFRSVVPFEFIFVEDVSMCLDSCFLCGCPVIPAPFVEEITIFSIVFPLILRQRSVKYIQ